MIKQITLDEFRDIAKTKTKLNEKKEDILFSKNNKINNKIKAYTFNEFKNIVKKYYKS